MNVRLLRFALVVGIVLFSARPAHADMMGFWRWWESLSGPGPFNGLAVELKPFTITTSGGPEIHFDPSEDTYLSNQSALRMSFQFGVLKAEDNPLDYGPTTAPGVWAIPISVNLDRNLIAGVEVGAGIGVVRFTGDGFGFWRMTVSPRVSIAPVSLAVQARSRQSEAFKVRFFFTGILGEFDSSDFGAFGDFKMGNEILFGTTFTVDVLALKR